MLRREIVEFYPVPMAFSIMTIYLFVTLLLDAIRIHRNRRRLIRAVLYHLAEAAVLRRLIVATDVALVKRLYMKFFF